MQEIRKMYQRLGPVLLLFVGLLLLYREPLTTGLVRMPVDEVDSRFNHYLLEHSYRWLVAHPLHQDLWSPPMFFPAKNTLAYSDAMVGYGWWYWPLRSLGLHPNAAYLGWMMLASVLNFAAMFTMLRRLFRVEVWAAGMGAFLFAFAVPRTAHLGHQQLLPQFYVLGLFAGLVWLIRRGPRASNVAVAGVAMGVAAMGVLQFYSGFYHFWFAGLGLVGLFIAGLLFRETRADLAGLLRRPLPLLAAAAAGALCLWPLLHLYLSALDEAGPRTLAAAYQMLPRLSSWVNTGPHHEVYGRWLGTLPIFTERSYPGEHVLGLGPATSLLVLLGFFHWRHDAWGRAAWVTIGLLIALTFHYSDLWNPWAWVVQVIPGATAIRAVSRVALLLLIPAGIALAMQMQAIRRPWVKVLAGLMVVVEQGAVRVPTHDAAMTWSRIETLAKDASRQPDPFYAVQQLEAAKSDWYSGVESVSQVDAMWAGLLANRPTINGYSGNAPTGWVPLYFATVYDDQDAVRNAAQIEGWRERHGAEIATVAIITNRGARR